jgi:hypothetical protein
LGGGGGSPFETDALLKIDRKRLIVLATPESIDQVVRTGEDHDERPDKDNSEPIRSTAGAR